ncbi:putative F-box/LRR-repeat protein 23 [Lactuca sativa]|uniref:putative F-box/LRR-repeat protein 23 n=1 Tax=Lactuca sativa TaxID=4236 RepID=UPI000CD9A971|nr:putative F-box/LRR-repeat protein 23 [Lactuca sativa]
MERPPNWLNLPEELIANILQRLSFIEILNSASKVKSAKIRRCGRSSMYHNWIIIVSRVVLKSTISLIMLSSKMKRLYIKSCDPELVTGGFIWAIKKLSQLEEFHLSRTYPTAKDIEDIGQNCPQLKSFSMNQVCQHPQNDDTALAIANNMPELRHLQVIGNCMTKIGLQAILNGCAHLESLDLRMCYYLRFGGKFEKLCMARIKDLKSPHDSMENCEFHQDYDDCDIYD